MPNAKWHLPTTPSAETLVIPAGGQSEPTQLSGRASTERQHLGSFHFVSKDAVSDALWVQGWFPPRHEREIERGRRKYGQDLREATASLTSPRPQPPTPGVSTPAEGQWERCLLKLHTSGRKGSSVQRVPVPGGQGSSLRTPSLPPCPGAPSMVSILPPNSGNLALTATLPDSDGTRLHHPPQLPPKAPRGRCTKADLKNHIEDRRHRHGPRPSRKRTCLGRRGPPPHSGSDSPPRARLTGFTALRPQILNRRKGPPSL